MKGINKKSKTVCSAKGFAGAVSSCFLFLLVLVISNASAVATELCIPIHAEIETSFTLEDCASPAGLCTAGQIIKGGILNGDTTFTALDVAPSAGLGGGYEPETTLSYTGVLELFTPHGTLTLTDVGVFDQANGVFSELDRVTDGTGRFAGASGVLFTYGASHADATGFIGEIRGELCLAR